ncbi:hypothetical protein KAU51_04700 [Candidatus Parcubacteria bacterium]|nr:hypothetical protein [Candidatus Parcubacteria bacterium]
MAHMKPIDLKEVAKRFTEQYYPQWLSRFDRIWEMFEKTDINKIVSDPAKFQYQQGNAFGITGTADPESKEYMSGIAIVAFTYQGTKDEDSISEDEVKKRISLVPNLKITHGLQQKLENVISEMLPLMVGESVAKAKNKKLTKQKTSERQTKEFVVYLARSSGFGTDNFLVNEEELHSKYLFEKRQYDIIIYHQNIEVKSITKKAGVEEIEFKPIEIYSNILNLLILFLKYKDENLPFLPLYHCAWRDSYEHVENDSEQDKMVDSLKHAVSTLRKYKNIINSFTIPNAKRGNNTYTCKGNFKFCLILKKSIDQRYTLEVN